MRLFLAGLAVAALLIPLDAFAQQPGQPGQGGRGGRGGQRGGFGGGFGGGNPIMTALDTDKDGELSAEEISAATKSLKTLDKNNDGKIDRAEQRPDFVTPLIARMMERDTNKDKKLSKSEVDDRTADRFGDMDGKQRRLSRRSRTQKVLHRTLQQLRWWSRRSTGTRRTSAWKQ